MKIAIIGYIGWYGSIAEWISDGFEANGHEVIKFDRKYMTSDINDCDIAVVVDCSEDYSDKLDHISIPKIAWLMDSHMPLGAERSVNIARKCDLVFSSNYEHGVKILEKFGIESYLMPVTYIDGMNGSYDEKYLGLEVAMIGHPNSPERIKLWEMLSEYKSFTGKADTKEDYNGIMGMADIVINQPTEPWDMILNNRFFEALGCSRLLLQKRLKTDLIERLGFEDGKHFVYWDNFEDLKEKIDYYLSSVIEQVDMRRKGCRQVKQYSMKNQCAKVMSIILSKFYERL